MEQINKLSVNFPLISQSPNLKGDIPRPQTVSSFSLESKEKYWHSLTDHSVQPSYQYIKILIYHDIIGTIYWYIICPGILSIRYIAYRLSNYPIGWISNRLFSLPSSLSKVLLFLVLNNRAFYAPIIPQLSEQRQLGVTTNRHVFKVSRCRRPPYSGRLSIAPPLTLAGQKGPIFQKKIGASGGWAEPHLLAFTVP